MNKCLVTYLNQCLSEFISDQWTDLRPALGFGVTTWFPLKTVPTSPPPAGAGRASRGSPSFAPTVATPAMVATGSISMAGDGMRWKVEGRTELAPNG